MEDGRDEEERVARERLRSLAPVLPPGAWERALFLPSNSNEVWRLDDVVLRVCWRGDRARMARETIVGQSLPAAMRFPSVLASGTHDDVTWQIVRHIPGSSLWDVWLDIEESRLRAIVSQLATMLKTLHAWTPPPAVAESLAAREQPHADQVGANLLPLPVERTMTLIEPARRLRYLDPDLLQAVERRLAALADIDPFARSDGRVVVHGDAQLSNLIVDDDGIAALVDYEWVRSAPPDSELAIWLHVLRVWRITAPERAQPPILRWLREDAPELFAPPDLEGRLWLYMLAFALRGVLVWPPDAPERELVAEHHVHALRALIDGPPTLP